MAMFTLRCLFRAGPDVTNPRTSLSYKDVFVLMIDDSGLQDDIIDDAGEVTSPANGFVRGLRAEGVPVCVLEGIDRVGGRVGQDTRVSDVAAEDKAAWKSRVADVAVSRTDWVTVAGCRCVQGLERRVVVWLTGTVGMDDRPSANRYRWLGGLTRCTTQLIMVSLHPEDSHTHTTQHTTTHTTQHTHTHPTSQRNAGDEGETTE